MYAHIHTYIYVYIHQEEELGGMFYDTVFQVSQSVRPYVNKPRSVMGAKFIEMMSCLESFHSDRNLMQEQVFITQYDYMYAYIYIYVCIY